MLNGLSTYTHTRSTKNHHGKIYHIMTSDDAFLEIESFGLDFNLHCCHKNSPNNAMTINLLKKSLEIMPSLDILHFGTRATTHKSPRLEYSHTDCISPAFIFSLNVEPQPNSSHLINQNLDKNLLQRFSRSK